MIKDGILLFAAIFGTMLMAEALMRLGA